MYAPVALVALAARPPKTLVSRALFVQIAPDALAVKAHHNIYLPQWETAHHVPMTSCVQGYARAHASLT